MRLKHVLLCNRPRERLRSSGVQALGDAELLAIILNAGTTGKNAVELGAELLERFGLERLRHALPEELCLVKGMGDAKASRVLAAFELHHRLQLQERPEKITCADDALRYCRPLLAHLEQEHFLVLHLDVRNQVRGHRIITKGLADSSLVHAREVFRDAIRKNAAAVIIAHNHPSNDPAPSEEDVAVTKTLCDAGRLLNIPVLDHLVITENACVSMMRR